MFTIENGIAKLVVNGKTFRCGFRPEDGDTAESVEARLRSHLPKPKRVVRHVLINADGTQTPFSKVTR